MNFIYNKGDRVHVRADIGRLGRCYSRLDSSIYNIVVHGMVKFADQIVTIAKCCGNGQYLIEEDDEYWSWVDSMFDGLDEEEEAPVVSAIPLEEFLARK